MLVRKCDVCGHIIEDEVGYMVDIFRTSKARCKTHDISIELCYDCEQAMCEVLNERMTKYVLQGKEPEEEK